MSAICSGCKTIKYYPLETVRHDTVYIQSVKLDSILVKDSIHILSVKRRFVESDLGHRAILAEERGEVTDKRPAARTGH